MNDSLAPQFEAPRRVEDAVALLAKHGDSARALAGGTDLLAQMKSGVRRPAVIVDLKRIDELLAVRESEAGLVIGAAVPAVRLREHGALRRLFPGLAEAAALIGSEQIQGRASLGGNLCNASPAADTTPALLVNEAVAEIAGPGGRRRLPVAALCTGPGQTALGEGELLVALHLPRPPAGGADAYLRLIPRTEMDIAVVGAAVRVTLGRDGRCAAARVALGAVAPTAIRVPEAEASLVGSRLEPEALARLVDAVRGAARPIDDKRGSVAYRRQVIGVLARRAAERAAERSRSTP
jgi:aerobic carbon-monoxide dehydrogenase medium subunit